MSFYDAFRGFFGFPGRGRPREPLFGGAMWDEEEEDDEDGDGPSLAQPPQDFTFGFAFGPGGSRGAFGDLFRDVGELLVPALPGPAEGSSGRPLRDSMLKQPDGPDASAAPGDPDGARDPARPWRPFLGLGDPRPAPPGLKEDQDLDSQVSSGGLGTILRPEEPPSRSYFQSISVTKVTLPDGAVEECRTVRDSRGRQETTVTRHGGGQTSGGTARDPREQLLGRGDRELAQFMGTWPDAANPGDPSAALGSFFRRWFSSW